MNVNRKAAGGLTDLLDASPRQAAVVLDEVDRLRRRSRGSLGPPWFPLVYFGLITILTAPPPPPPGRLSWHPSGSSPAAPDSS